MTIAERLAEHALQPRDEDLSAAARDATKTFLLDSLAVAVAGSSTNEAAALRPAVRRWGEAPEASVLGTGLRLPAPSAALLNAQQLHGQEFDCVHEDAVVHAMSVVLPAALAFAERAGGVSGARLLSALARGVDVAVTLGLNSAGEWRFFRPATAGIFGATAALGRLGGLARPALVDAFGIALAQAGGTMQPHAEGKPLLPLQMGFAARNAIVAVDLARAGIEGTRETFEGARGYFALFEGGAPPAALAELGRRPRVAELSHKPFPSGRATHGLIDGLLRLRAAHGVAAEQVARVRLLGSPLIVQLVARPLLPGMGPAYARLCAPYVGAVALAQGGLDLGDFTPERLRDPAIAALAERIVVERDPAIEGRVLLPQRIELTLTSGAMLGLTVTDVLGSPARPLSRRAALAKVERCLERSAEPLPPEAAARLPALVDRLEALDDIAPLLRLCRAATA